MRRVHRTDVPNGHPNLWAFLTLATFPVVLIATDMIGLDGIWPFVYAALATLIVLALEGVIRGRLWPFEPHFAETLGHPDTPIRIILFLGAILLVLETALIALFAFDRKANLALLGLVARTQCAAWNDPVSSAVCRRLEKEDRPASATMDGTTYALRARAEDTWYPDESLVTCSVRKTDAWNDGTALRLVALVHCAAWTTDGYGGLSPKTSTTRYAAASIPSAQQGFPTVSGWSDNMNDPAWDTVLGTHAEEGRDRVRSSTILPEYAELLRAEARMRAMDLLKK
ncbi:hypothetical protein L0Y59_02000 [Candidatus Uhrbacteria bacterium]|nr:hypothetical protein [Candidatus Uhrbacteria bacterium]